MTFPILLITEIDFSEYEKLFKGQSIIDEQEVRKYPKHCEHILTCGLLKTFKNLTNIQAYQRRIISFCLNEKETCEWLKDL